MARQAGITLERGHDVCNKWSEMNMQSVSLAYRADCVGEGGDGRKSWVVINTVVLMDFIILSFSRKSLKACTWHCRRVEMDSTESQLQSRTER